ncbi:MAG: zinc ribbon domain-containing protein, partial [Nitrospiraceae bacterium]
MKCIKCGTENNSSLSDCEKCGAPLPVIIKSNPRRRKTIAVSLTLLLVCSGIGAYVYRDSIIPPVQVKDTILSVDKDKGDKERQEKQKETAAYPGRAKKAPSADSDSKKTVTTKTAEIPPDNLKNGYKTLAGKVVITDPWGKEVASFRVGVAGNGWLALPSRACLGGKTWYFYPDSGGKVQISDGLWINGDKVGLWHLADDTGKYNGPELAVWNDREPVSWVSLESENEYNSVTLSDQRVDGFFVSASLPDYINETGMFMQNKNIVGWSFGQWLAKGFMWPGGAGTGLKYNTWVRYFYNVTFANGREEKFARALAMQKGHSSIEQLTAFVEGFQLQPKLALEDTPFYLLPEEIIKQVRDLVSNALHSGEGSRVIDILSSQVLKSIGDIDLLMIVVPAIVDNQGFEAAISEIEDSGRYITLQMERDVPEVDKLHAQLYQEWLQSLVSAGEIIEGLRVYNAAIVYYPDDPYIHLLGVELTLLNEYLDEAERMLYMRNYPPDLQDRYQLL